ncbi:MAG: GNAT family N-acetyltransferase [Acidaminobacter sp.]|uniref:GNAT family N-acetyltransferase n=1 Tax=Acidaminobacter sp. TaxID=1872102 RepID=UPI0013845A37|nr:GNAT family N-acetyltransferase [Acidaminobacter sp.]MZQ98397.1 GNAT family N-acetyltransferase [Acidaminobacter sp.]
MRIRDYNPSDCAALSQLFYDTVHAVNAKDYTQAQLEVWATGTVDLAAWNQSFLEHLTLVAELDDIIVGFADMDHQGHLDRLYVHKDYQGKGIATALVKALEQRTANDNIEFFETYASITARPFFEKLGYTLQSKNTVVRGSVSLTNFKMTKKPTTKHG